MKKKMLAILLPITAGVALAGTGFGAWVFSNNVSSANQGANITVTAAINVKGLKVVFEDTCNNPNDDSDTKSYSGNTLVLDQEHDSDMFIAYHFEMEPEAIDGVINSVTNDKPGSGTGAVYQTSSSQNSATYSATSNLLTTTKKYTITYSCSFDFVLDNAAETYLADPDLDSGSSAKTLTDATMTYVYNSTSGWHLDDTEELTTAMVTTFDWNATDQHIASGVHQTHSGNAKPESVEEYNAMVEAFNDHPGSVVLELNDFAVSGVVCEDVA